MNQVILDKNIITSELDNNNQNKRKKTQRENTSMNPINKLRISLKDINAQFNLGNINDNLNKNTLNENFAQNFPMTTPIRNKYINLNEFFSFNFKNQIQSIFEPKTLGSTVSIKNKELKFLYDDFEPKKKKYIDIITEGQNIKNKHKNKEEHKKTWERLLSPKMKRKSELNIFDTYFTKYRNLKKNKTMNAMKLSRSSKNFFSNFS